MAQQVPRKPTPANENQLVLGLVHAWQKLFGSDPTKDQIGKLFSHVALETGNGKYIFNNNVGNITWTNGFPGDWYPITDSYSVGGNPANRKSYQAKMRSYDTLDDGILDYLKLIKNRPGVLDAVNSGSAKDFSYALANVHYYDPYIKDDYTNKEGKKVPGYTTGLTARYRQFMGKDEPDQTSQQTTAKEPPTSNKLLSFFQQIGKFLDSFAAKNESTINKQGYWNRSIRKMELANLENINGEHS